jgi:hypothetical protein
VPHFHHEFVKKAATLAVERPERLPAVVALLAALFTMSLVTETQMGMGFQRMRDTVGDLELDVPGATLRLAQVRALCLTHSSCLCHPPSTSPTFVLFTLPLPRTPWHPEMASPFWRSPHHTHHAQCSVMLRNAHTYSAAFPLSTLDVVGHPFECSRIA